jgi:hypothetical protein
VLERRAKVKRLLLEWALLTYPLRLEFRGCRPPHRKFVPLGGRLVLRLKLCETSIEPARMYKSFPSLQFVSRSSLETSSSHQLRTLFSDFDYFLRSYRSFDRSI